MKQNRGWLIAVGCLALIGLAVCVGGIVLVISYQDEIQAALNDTGGGVSLLSETATPTPGTVVSPDITLGDMQAFIDEHDGKPCEEVDKLTCVTLTVPFDHNDSSNTKTIDVVFGIHPATGERFGMFVQAFPGGPGGAGIGSSASRVEKFDKKILEHYDIVYFDQRGVGLSSPVSCTNALESYYSDGFSEYNTEGEEGPDTPQEQQKVIDGAKTFAENCVKEIGLEPDELKLYDTDQVVGDIETFREAVGDDKFYIYGVSYGTVVAQTYAASHADHLAGMVLDGTVDMTLDGATSDKNQIKAFEKALLATLDACSKDSECSADFGGDDPLQVYDDMAASLSKTPAKFEFPLPDGTKPERLMTLSKLETTATFSMYSGASRMIFLRTLAAAHRGDYVPMARLLYALQDFDPATERYVGDPNFSYTDFFLVNCADVNYFTGTVDERVQKILTDSEASYGLTPRLDGGLYSDLACTFWPNSPSAGMMAAPLKAEGVPTLVLNATLDPATPFEGGEAVASRLDDGYHIYVDGGEHGTYLNDEPCPDDYVTNLLVYGETPDEREIKCTWKSPVMWTYQRPGPSDAKDIGNNLLLFIYTTDFDILFTPEFLFSSGDEGLVEAACPYGGKFSFELDKPNDMENFTFTDCEYTRGFAMTGTGYFNVDNGDRGLDIDISGDKTGHLNFELIIDPQSISLTGDYGGQSVNIQR